MKKLIFILILLCASILTNAQQDPMFTHYAFNTLAINPAYAGTRDALTITGLHRAQWVTFKGAPITQTITGHSPIFNETMRDEQTMYFNAKCLTVVTFRLSIVRQMNCLCINNLYIVEIR